MRYNRKTRYKKNDSTLVVFMCLGSIGTMILCILYAIFTSIIFNVKIGDYLKQSADANSIELAEQQLTLAIDEIEKRHLTSGSTGVFYKSPSSDIGFWYTNLKDTQKSLQSISPNADNMEKSNVLIKLRETILDGSSVTKPTDIHLYPYNILFAVIFIFSVAGWTISWCIHEWNK